MPTPLVRPEATATFTLVDPVVIDPETLVHSEGFEATLGGWAFTSPSTTVSRRTTIGTVAIAPRSGSWMLGVGAPAPYQTKAVRTVTGLEIGREYTFRAWAGRNIGSAQARVGVTGIGESSWVSGWVDLTPAWKECEYTFTATATSHELFLEGDIVGAGSGTVGLDAWDDITLTASAVLDTTAELTIAEGKVTLDDGWSPYIQATFEVPLTGLDLIEQIDPMENQRVVVEASEAIGGSSRTFDLGLRGRRVDHKRRRITVDLASDEALLIDKRRLASTVDTTPRPLAASLRNVVDWALDKVGAALEAGTDDADLTPYWPAKNLHQNPSATTETFFTAGTGASDLQFSSAVGGFSGTGGVRWTAAAGTSNLILDTSATHTRVDPGKTYTVSTYIRSSTARTAGVVIRWYDSSGNLISPNTVGSTATTSTSNWNVRIHATGVAPANAAYMSPFVNTVSNSAGQFHYVDGCMIHEGSELEVWFNGNSTQAGYTFAWQDAASTSVSIRTPDVDRPRELFSWKPGQSLWDFLSPLLETAGLRLFCDEARDWRLVDLSTYEVEGNIPIIEKVNAIQGEDAITRNDDTWATGAVCVWRWTDEFGIHREAYDFAGTDEKVVTVEYDREYPGPGAAAAILIRLQGKGRTQDVERLTDYAASPGMYTTINLPGSLPQGGPLQQVVFDLKSGLMQLANRALAEATPGSWLAVGPALEWDDTGTTDIDWEDWV